MEKKFTSILSLKVLGDLSSRHLMLDNFKYRSIRSFLFSLSRQFVTVIARQLDSTTTMKCLQGHLGTETGGGGLQELTTFTRYCESTITFYWVIINSSNQIIKAPRFFLQLGPLRTLRIVIVSFFLLYLVFGIIDSFGINTNMFFIRFLMKKKVF